MGVVQSAGDVLRFRDAGWYRVPRNAKVTLGSHWPPQWVAAFETIKTGSEAQRIRYYGKVDRIEIRTREELFPGVPAGTRAGKMYYQLHLSQVHTLAKPLIPARWRRNPFIETTLRKLLDAEQFNDLFGASSYEDELWTAFKAYNITAERQWPVITSAGQFFLDFALFCNERSVDVEVDGRPHHAIEARSISDAARDRALASNGWGVVRFTTSEIRKRLSYCLEQVSATIRKYGGLEGAPLLVQHQGGLAAQMPLLEEPFRYDEEPQ